jgi:hypothetical protein
VKPKAALIIGAVCAFVFGAMLIRSPDAILRGLGVPTYGDGIILGRDMGIVVIGMAVLNWSGRNAVGNGLRAILIANLFVHLGGLALHGGEISSHQLPGSAWPSMSIQTLLAAMFGLALVATRERNRRRGDGVLPSSSSARLPAAHAAGSRPPMSSADATGEAPSRAPSRSRGHGSAVR